LHTSASRSRSPLQFFWLVFTLSLPFWLLGAATGLRLLPDLLVSALMACCPLLAAAILVYRENKSTGVRALLRRAVDYRRIVAKGWYVPIVLLLPSLMAVTYGLMRVAGALLPSPAFPALAVLAPFAVFFIGALGEELGWSGYASIRCKRDGARSRPACSWG